MPRIFDNIALQLLPASTVHMLIKELLRLGIITEITGQLRGRVYIFERYYNLFLEGKA